MRIRSTIRRTSGSAGTKRSVWQFAEGDMKRPLFGSHLPQAIHRQVDAFADAHSRSADEQEGIRVEIISPAQLLLHELILLRGKRSGKIAGLWREVFSTNEIRLNGVAATEGTANGTSAIGSGRFGSELRHFPSSTGSR
jgi:hypothetical protein